jgi:hypothetical protein
MSETRSDSDLREALLGTWRLIRWQDVDGATPMGDSPLGYLVYTSDEHVFAELGIRTRTGDWPGSEVLEMPAVAAIPALGFIAYCGTFEVHDDHVIHHMEFGTQPRMNGLVATRSVELIGDRLVLRTPRGERVEWQRVH